jgi:hypothetical protein
MTVTKKTVWILGVFVTLAIAQPRLDAVAIFQIETFDDPHDWVIGAGPTLGSPTPVPVALGGPSGATDPYLSIVSSGGTGPGSRLSAQNFGLWAGDYLAAGIGSIGMDIKNSGPADLSLRLLVLELGPMGPVSGAFSTAAIFVPAGGDWTNVVFDLSPAALTSFLGTAQGALSNASELRIFHNPNPFFQPSNMPAVAAALGVDNIQALPSAVAEPATLTLLAAGALAAARNRRRRRN